MPMSSSRYAVDGASRMQRLIQDLLTYSRVGTRGADLRRHLERGGTASKRCANLQGAIEESGAVVTHDPLPAVLADEMQLVQLFQNLVGNAIKYQGPGVPEVHISAGRDGVRNWTFVGDRQRPGDRPAILRPDLRDVPAPARTGRVRRYRHRARNQQEDRRATRRDASRSSRASGRAPPSGCPDGSEARS